MAKARADLLGRYNLKLKLVESEAVGRTNALRSGLDEAEHHKKAAAATLTLVQTEVASARAELLSLPQQVASTESSAQ